MFFNNACSTLIIPSPSSPFFFLYPQDIICFVLFCLDE